MALYRILPSPPRAPTFESVLSDFLATDAETQMRIQKAVSDLKLPLEATRSPEQEAQEAEDAEYVAWLTDTEPITEEERIPLTDPIYSPERVAELNRRWAEYKEAKDEDIYEFSDVVSFMNYIKAKIESEDNEETSVPKKAE